VTDCATLLRDHVTLKVRSIDRIFLQAYVPKLQSVGQVCTFLRWQRGFRIPSSAAFGKIGEQYEGHRALRQGQRHPDRPLRKGREQGGEGQTPRMGKAADGEGGCRLRTAGQRGCSSSPARRSRKNRCRHLPTIWRGVSRRAAITSLPTSWVASKTILARMSSLYGDGKRTTN
jgi:hypothetical protein